MRVAIQVELPPEAFHAPGCLADKIRAAIIASIPQSWVVDMRVSSSDYPRLPAMAVQEY